MSKAMLSTLPLDLSFEILGFITHNPSDSSKKARISALRNLSLTCSSLNSLCAHIIFHTYHLDIRAPLRWSSTGNYFLKGLNGAPRNAGDDSIQTRLVHLRSKSPFIREIYITDQGDPDSSITPFPRSFTPELLATLYTLKSLTAVHILTHDSPDRPSAVISPSLWQWLLEVNPSTLSLIGQFEIPQEGAYVFRPIENINDLRIHSCTNANRILIDMHTPRTLSLSYSRDCFKYTPSAHLTSISVTINLQGREHVLSQTGPLFDFSNVPNAEVKVLVMYLFDYMRGAPTWQDLRPLLQPLFVEDLAGYDVRCHALGMVNITRSGAVGWVPTYQDHLMEVG